MSKRIFVYGSLRRGQQANRSLRDCKFLEEVTLPGFDMYAISWFPGIRHNPANEQGVVGELYELPEDEADRDALMKHLDYYEGYNPNHEDTSLFVRRKIDVNGDESIIYLFNKNPEKIQSLPVAKVESGDWVEYKEKHNAA
jgi:gamma-glutamylcyclotransferase (GGCT)/AIG2-like uncharacterized protein YtfP